MAAIERLLGGAGPAPAPDLLRPHQPGDIGWVAHRHGVLYAEEYGWDESFEALVAEVAAKFVTGFDARRERGWIAERDGAIVGSVFLVRQSDEVATLRLLLVEPAARRIYQAAGVALVAEARHHGFGHELVGQIWELARRRARRARRAGASDQ